MKNSIIAVKKADTDRGQVGIGTLIVFIALVLVAAIAAGVLINTAGFLQSQAESTGEGSTSQVSDNLEVVNTIGEVETAGEIGKIELTVTKAPGSGTIDLRQLAIQYVGPGGSEIIGLSGEDASGANIPSADGSLDYGLQQIQSENDFVLSEDRDQYKIVIGIGSGGGNTVASGGTISTLEKGDDATLTINTAQGSQQTVDITIPDSVDTASSNDDVRI